MVFNFVNRDTWAQQCKLLGAKKILCEKSTYEDMHQGHMQEYAVGSRNQGLIGSWHPVTGKGIIFQRPIMAFSAAGRKFVEEKL